MNISKSLNSNIFKDESDSDCFSETKFNGNQNTQNKILISTV